MIVSVTLVSIYREYEARNLMKDVAAWLICDDNDDGGRYLDTPIMELND